GSAHDVHLFPVLSRRMSPTENWSRFLRLAVGLPFAFLVFSAAFIGAMNPYGNLPNFVVREHVIMDSDQRFQYPAILRAHRHDSLVIGTSTARLLEPKALDAAFGGRHAVLAMNAATAWEQTQIAKLFLRHVPHPRRLIVGLDGAWCDGSADVNRITFRGFPGWLYDDEVLKHLPYMLNGKALEIAVRRLAHALGLARAPIDRDGYGVFVPPDVTYDLKRAQWHIWGPAGPRTRVASAAPITENDPRPARFPALAWLPEILGNNDETWQEKILVFMPIHAAAQPAPGSEGEARER